MKKFILSLFVGLFGIISFCSAISFQNSFYCPYQGNCGNKFNVENIGDLKIQTDYASDFKYYYYSTIGGYVSNQTINTGVFDTSLGVKHYYRYASNNDYFVYVQVINPCGGSSCNIKYTYTISGGSCPECPTCDPQYSSEQCQSVYGLVSSGLLNNCQSDLNSCQSNTSGFNDQLNNCNLSLNACNSSLTNCLQYNCPEVDYTGDLQFSNLYINNILHPGKQNIFVNIPDYITWDYNFTGDDFNLDVGSGYDVDYIESVIDINSYRPTSEDFTNVFVSGLTLVMPYIVIALFIIFVRKLIRRIFK